MEVQKYETAEEVRERLKNVPLEQMTKEDVIDRYIYLRNSKDYKNVRNTKITIEV